MPGAIPYLPGRPPAAYSPLARYLPPIPEGVAPVWLAEKAAAGALVLDPFGASPRLAVEAARAGYRVVVAANNPVARFLFEMAARPCTGSELRSGLAELAASYKGDERLEPHLRSLYKTECAQCGQEVEAEAFLWERGASAPYARLYHCHNCSDAGERPVTVADVARATGFGGRGLHRARALERVAPLDDPDRPFVEEALETYPPRAVYALFTLVNKLESFPPAQRRPLTALLLAAFDQANTLWAHPAGRARPRQLTVPPRFREHNIWRALEDAADAWTDYAGSGVFLSYWPDLPPVGGRISLFEGRLKDLSERLSPAAQGKPEALEIGAVLTALPRPNQAYWTLSALWAGWLWGRAAAAPFKSVLRRRRYDWAWHSTALHAAFSSLIPLLRPGTPILGLVGEAEPGFLSAALLSAALAGLELDGVALRAEEDQAQIHWTISTADRQAAAAKGAEPTRAAQGGSGNAGSRAAGESAPETAAPRGPAAVASAAETRAIQAASTAGALAYLRQRGEPAPYLPLHTAALEAFLASSDLDKLRLLAPADALGQVQAAFQQVFTYRSGFARFGGSEHSLEVGLWWLKDELLAKEPEPLDAPLADRLEMEAVRFLQKNPSCSLAELDAALCRAFPALQTPDLSLVRACLESYGEQDPAGSDRWRLSAKDAPKQRREELAEIQALIEQMGRRLEYTVSGSQPLVWRAQAGEASYVFYILASAVLGKVLLDAGRPSGIPVMVYPGGRAGLLKTKLDRDPRLNALVTTAGWRLVKFRHLRRLAGQPHLARANLASQWNLDPVSDGDPQLPLL